MHRERSPAVYVRTVVRKRLTREQHYNTRTRLFACIEYTCVHGFRSRVYGPRVRASINHVFGRDLLNGRRAVCETRSTDDRAYHQDRFYSVQYLQFCLEHVAGSLASLSIKIAFYYRVVYSRISSPAPCEFRSIVVGRNSRKFASVRATDDYCARVECVVTERKQAVFKDLPRIDGVSFRR